jgi:prepilin-type N-terminal cleavage/methylation domain-containing protein
MRRRDESGFTLVELMVAIMLFSILSIGFYQVMISSVGGSENTQEIAQISQEARLGLNRMIRDTREVTEIITATPTSYRIWVDFDADDVVDADAYEHLEYSFVTADNTIMMTPLEAPTSNLPDPGPVFTGAEGVLAGEEAEVLVAGVAPAPGRDVFSYASNFLQYDTNGDGEASSAELDTAIAPGDAAGLNDDELAYISEVNYALTVSVDGRNTDFYGQASIRSRRYSDL